MKYYSFMKAPLNNQAYIDPQVHSIEQEKIFYNSWLFAGLKTSLKYDGDYVSFRLNNIPIFIQNYKGELKAFRNVCSHRRSPIFEENTSGNRKATCLYHGWSYDNKGRPSGVPRKNTFKNLNDEKINSLCLEEFDLDFCGNIIFIKRKQFAVSLKNYLGNYFEELQTISNSFGKIQTISSYEIKCNWKIAVENALEPYHVGEVHQSTFVGILSSDPKKGKDSFDNRHSSWQTSLEEKTEKKMKRIEHIYEHCEYKIDGYKHIFIFPNFAIATTKGHNFGIQLYDPTAANSINFTNYVIGPKVSTQLDKKSSLLLDHMLASTATFNSQVFKEDAEICEKVQKTSGNSIYESELSEILEMRVFDFQKQCFVSCNE